MSAEIQAMIAGNEKLWRDAQACVELSGVLLAAAGILLLAFLGGIAWQDWRDRKFFARWAELRQRIERLETQPALRQALVEQQRETKVRLRVLADHLDALTVFTNETAQEVVGLACAANNSEDTPTAEINLDGGFYFDRGRCLRQWRERMARDGEAAIDASETIR